MRTLYDYFQILKKRVNIKYVTPLTTSTMRVSLYGVSLTPTIKFFRCELNQPLKDFGVILSDEMTPLLTTKIRILAPVSYLVLGLFPVVKL